MKRLLLLFFLLLVALGETSVLPFFPIFGTHPSLLLVLLLALQFLGFGQESYYGAFFGGLFLDLLWGSPLGLGSLILLLLMRGVSLARRFAGSSPLVVLLITFLTAIVFRAVRVFPLFYLPLFLRGGLLDVGVMLFIYPVLRYFLKTVFGKRELQVGV